MATVDGRSCSVLTISVRPYHHTQCVPCSVFYIMWCWDAHEHFGIHKMVGWCQVSVFKLQREIQVPVRVETIYLLVHTHARIQTCLMDIHLVISLAQFSALIHIARHNFESHSIAY